MQPIILLHGALGAAAAMSSLRNVLDANAEVHLMDFSGHGEAQGPDIGFSIETFEADVLRLMDAHGMQQAHIFGYSMGGFVGLRLALKMPDRVCSVTTLATKMDWTEQVCAREASMLDADAMESKIPKFVTGLQQLHGKEHWRNVVDRTRTLLLNMHRYRFSSEALAAITQPVRMIVGDRDKMVSIDETIEAYGHLPLGSASVLPDTPHPFEAVNKPLLGSLILSQMAKINSSF